MNLQIKLKKYKGNEQIVFIIFMLFPIMQLINSFILYSSNGESILGKAFRLITIILMILMSYKSLSYKGFFIILVICISCIPTIIVDSIRGFDIGVIEWVNSILKIISPIIYFLSLKSLYDRKQITREVIHSILVFWAWFMSLSMVIPYILGMGNSKYDGYGYTGFYYENDSYNITACCLLAVFLSEAINLKRKKYYILSFFLMVSVILTGSKVALVYGSIIIMWALFMNKKMTVKNSLKIWLSIVLVFAMIIFIIKGNSLIKQQIQYYIDVFKFSRISYGDTPLDIFTNGRTKRALYCIKYLWSKDNILDVLFGIGGYGIEMDFFDTYMKMGIIPSVIIIYVCLVVVCKCRKVKNMEQISFSLLLILIYAIVAGHVVESSFTCGIISMFVFLIFTAEKKSGRIIYENNSDCNSGI